MSSFNHTRILTSPYIPDLASQYNDGNITITNSTTLNTTYNNVATIFDGGISAPPPPSDFYALDNNEVACTTTITFNSNTANKLVNEITFWSGTVLSGRIQINEGLSDDTGEISWTARTATGNINTLVPAVKNIISLSSAISHLQSIKIYWDTFDTGIANGNNDVRFYELSIKAHIPINESDLFEFNDSVLTTKAWNSSRYSGRQLQASAINEFTSGDVTYGKTPVLQNYTRNIYLGSRVIGMESGSNDDPTLTQFNGFSYVTVHEYITVNDDLSITRKSIRSTGDEKRDFVSKKGFYPIFYHDFPIGSEIEINTLDEKLVESLKPSYKVFNNSGQLQRLLLVQSHPDSGSKYNVHYSQSNQLFYATGSNVNSLGAKFTIFNQRLIMDEFFTGSLVATPPAWAGGSNPIEDSGDAVNPGGL